MSDLGWVTIAEYGAAYEAELAAGRLESAGIPSRIDRHDAVGLFGPGHGGLSVRGVALLVPEVSVDAAREALDLEATP
jgi:hypothetical protein